MSGYLNLSKQTINSGIKSLEQAGYIRPTGGPGRKKYLELTQAGQALAERTARPVLNMEQRAFQAMSPTERAALLTLTRRHLELRLREAEQIFQQPQEE